MEVKSWVMSVFNDDKSTTLQTERFVGEEITGTTLLS